MVTAADVWDALAEIPDPEIPVISLVDLGVVRQVEVEGSQVRVEFTPTFLGCPALETMREAMNASIRELGGEPEVQVVVDDSWSTDRITPEGREKLREAGFAPPAPRGPSPPSLVQLRAARSSAPTAAPPTRAWRTSSAPRRAGRSATARAAASRSSSSRRSEGRRWEESLGRGPSSGHGVGEPRPPGDRSARRAAASRADGGVPTRDRTHPLSLALRARA